MSPSSLYAKQMTSMISITVKHLLPWECQLFGEVLGPKDIYPQETFPCRTRNLLYGKVERTPTSSLCSIFHRSCRTYPVLDIRLLREIPLLEGRRDPPFIGRVIVNLEGAKEEVSIASLPSLGIACIVFLSTSFTKFYNDSFVVLEASVIGAQQRWL
jgi:hypothetical protein